MRHLGFKKNQLYLENYDRLKVGLKEEVVGNVGRD